MQAQKHDYMWALGMGPGWSDYRFFYDFGSAHSPGIVVRSDTMSTSVYAASYCNKEGKILFYSNGISILNKNGEYVENSYGLNPTLPNFQIACYQGGTSCFFLESPADPNILYFISLDVGLHPAQQWPYQYMGKNLMVATIDVQANNGSGKVIEKNKILLTGTLRAPTACRHANGRDWWILVSDADWNRHYRVLLSSEGFSAPITQNIGSKSYIPGVGTSIVGNCFSPQGNYYADVQEQLGFSIFSFDRCSGLLSAEKRYTYPPPLPNSPMLYRYSEGLGNVFSPDEKLFYKTNRYQPTPGTFPVGTIPCLFQFDLSAQDLSAAIDTINIIDPLDFWPYGPGNDGYYDAELGPDGRVYVVHEGVSYCTIQYPNVRGRGCKFIHNDPYFGVVIAAAIPYFPNYRLGPLDGSPCDTLGINNIPVANFRVDDTLGAFSRYFYDLSHHEPDHWHWDFGDGYTSNEQSPLHTFPGPGIYGVCLTVSNPYGAHSECKTLYLGVSEVDNLPTSVPIEVSPNPFSGTLLIRMPVREKAVLYLYDQLNRPVRSITLQEELTALETGKLPPGVYFWKVVAKRGVVGSGKVVNTGF